MTPVGDPREISGRMPTLEEAAQETLKRLDEGSIEDPYRYINSIAWCVQPLKEALAFSQQGARVCGAHSPVGVPTCEKPLHHEGYHGRKDVEWSVSRFMSNPSV